MVKKIGIIAGALAAAAGTAAGIKYSHNKGVEDAKRHTRKFVEKVIKEMDQAKI